VYEFEINFLFEYRIIDVIDAVLQSIMPKIKKRCGGLSNPSRPKLECQKKSNGPAPTSTAIPKIASLTCFACCDFVSLGKFFQLKNLITVLVSAIATPA